MKNFFITALLSTALTGCMVTNYDTKKPAPDDRKKTTIKWNDGTKTTIKPPAIENHR